MKRLWTSLVQRLAGHSALETAAAQPVLAGYRHSMRPGLKLGLLIALAIACFAYAFGFSLLAPARMMPFTVPPAIMGVLIIWALPTGDYAPTRALDPLFFAFFASLILWPNYLAIALPSLPWVTLLRLFAVPLAVVFLICASSSPLFRRRMGGILNADPIMWKMLAGLVFIQFATILLSRDPGSSLNRVIIAQFNCTVLFFVSAYLFHKRGFAELWVRLFVLMLAVLCVFGIWEGNLRAVPWAGNIPSFLKVGDEAVMKILAGAARKATGIYRVQAVHTTSLGFAEILGLAVPFALHFAMERYPTIVRILGAAFVPLAFYVIQLTDSRLGVVASAASILFYMLIWSLIRWRQHKQSILGPAVVLAYPGILLAALISTFVVGRIRAEVWGNGPQQASTDARKIQWAMATPKVIRNPFGNGAASSGEVLGFTNQAGAITVDSYYITILLDWGIAGFLLFFGLMIRAIWIGGRTVVARPVEREIRLLIPLIVSLINFVIIKSVLSQDANHPIVFIMLGAILALVWRAQSDAAQNAQYVDRLGSPAAAPATRR